MENSNYIAEAFQKLSLVEDDFNISTDVENANDLRSYIADDVDLPAEEKIIDVAAEDENDLQDTYVGKVILECSCCHTRIYKDISEVVIDDETNLANIEEVCPVCSTASGFNVLGKIEAFEDENKLPEEEKVDEGPPADDIPEDDLPDEVIKEALKSVKESLAEDISEVTIKTNEGKAKVSTEDAGKVTVDLTNDDIPLKGEDESIVPLTDKEETTIEGNGNEEEAPVEEVPVEDEFVDLEAAETPLEDTEDEEAEEEVEESLNKNARDKDYKKLKDLANKKSKNNKELGESKLTEGNLADRVRANLARKIAELDGAEVNEDCSLEEDNDLKAKVRANLLRKLNLTDEPKTFEENFNKLGTAYLKRVYENVNNFTTSKVVNLKNKLVVEGVINFASGNKKDTKFVFENKNKSTKGITSYTGMNETFSNAKKAFNLRGKEVNNRFIPESMVYSYNTKVLNEDNSSKLFKVCGRVIVK